MIFQETYTAYPSVYNVDLYAQLLLGSLCQVPRVQAWHEIVEDRVEITLIIYMYMASDSADAREEAAQELRRAIEVLRKTEETIAKELAMVHRTIALMLPKGTIPSAMDGYSLLPLLGEKQTVESNNE